MIDDLRRFLKLHGVTPAWMPSVESKLPDWERFLRKRGVTEIPDEHLADKWTEAQKNDYFQVMTLFTQEAQSQRKRLKIPRRLERMLAQSCTSVQGDKWDSNCRSWKRRRPELTKFHAPSGRGGDTHAPANTSGIRHVAFAVDDIDTAVASVRARGAELVGEVERYEDSHRLCYVRGPEGIIVELAEQIG